MAAVMSHGGGIVRGMDTREFHRRWDMFIRVETWVCGILIGLTYGWLIFGYFGI